LKDYDYSQPGAYFITLVSYQRECLFGDVIEEKMQVSLYGKIILQGMQNLPNHYP
jgi:putative transposase